MTRILAIETSCDETAVAIVEHGRRVLSSVISSQADFHSQYGGVIPEFAARQHLDMLAPVLDEALLRAKLTLGDIDAFAATLGPGLVGALLVGATAAKTLSFLEDKPFLGVNHLYGHIASNYLESDLAPPFVCLLVSGGHTQLIHVRAYDDLEILGQTLDDAVGEAYDKVARMLGLAYPGGPNLDKLAQTASVGAYMLPTGKTERPWDFSYSGLKTAMLRLIERELAGASLTPSQQASLAAAFQSAATQVLIDKTLRLAQNLGCSTIAVAGGVAANSALRAGFQSRIHTLPDSGRLYVPPLVYCTDNAAMIAASAYFNPITDDPRVEVFSRGQQPQLFSEVA